ncbi:Uncharacterised protein [Mycobacteroides abscessus subsp. abscessus]|nr:Uncharacterised protein [Mycobacteroides abscessus subsp. abscessus]
MGLRRGLQLRPKMATANPTPTDQHGKPDREAVVPTTASARLRSNPPGSCKP